MEIIHLSDLHFGDSQAPFSENELSDALSTYVVGKAENPILILSGDITVKGRIEGYEFATRFVENLIKNTGISRHDLCFCPGNHDVVEGSFDAFSRFAYGARRDRELDFTRDTYKKIVIQDTLFFIINSSFHLNHKFGLVDDKCFDEDLLEFEGMRKVIVFHHHILNQFDDDISAIRNAYDLVQFIERHSFSLALHGHQHTEQLYHLGRNTTPVISARSGNFNQTGFFNAFNHYKLVDDKITMNSFAFERAKRSVKVRKIGEVN
ncbi:metallophosphoesterase [Shewanella sp. 11B5]|uniref:metallophosphoesterase family protein n=1 Tax=Shewanella sp. 11B5 TaxID=2058298 RepID=UPI000C7B2D7B|nr:metallophosphoesterase [Shewanella sp. 11B5]PKI07122.1 metallophosphoesterase [Shewanella sp. 11B5]